MTREDLEEKYEDCFTASTRASEGGMGPDVTDGHKLWRLLDPIIASYAKQQAIAFDEWKVSNRYRASLNMFGELVYEDDSDHCYDAQELYNQFIEQQNKP